MDILTDAPIMNIVGNEFEGLEGEEFIKQIIQTLGLEEKSVRDIYHHYIGGNEIKKATVLAIPRILEKGEIIRPWRKGHNKNLKTVIQAAPINIGGNRYICCVVNSKNANNNIRPYSIRLFNEKEIEEMP